MVRPKESKNKESKLNAKENISYEPTSDYSENENMTFNLSDLNRSLNSSDIFEATETLDKKSNETEDYDNEYKNTKK